MKKTNWLEISISFCKDFLNSPYFCYTEHGLHAYFYQTLFNYFKTNNIELFNDFCGQSICRIQKEYPTCTNLGRSRRQNWDISVLQTPFNSFLPSNSSRAYDCFKLESVFEFGLNSTKKHLKNDLERICHPEANLINPFIFHFYRLGDPVNSFSGHDWSNRSPRILQPEEIKEMITDERVIVFYARFDGISSDNSSLCIVKKDLCQYY